MSCTFPRLLREALWCKAVMTYLLNPLSCSVHALFVHFSFIVCWMYKRQIVCNIVLELLDCVSDELSASECTLSSVWIQAIGKFSKGGTLSFSVVIPCFSHSSSNKLHRQRSSLFGCASLGQPHHPALFLHNPPPQKKPAKRHIFPGTRRLSEAHRRLPGMKSSVDVFFFCFFFSNHRNVMCQESYLSDTFIFFSVLSPTVCLSWHSSAPLLPRPSDLCVRNENQ